MESVLDAFQGRVARRLTGRLPHRGRDGKWVYPPLAGVLMEVEFVRARTSVLWRQNMVAQFIATRPILGLCMVAEQWQGYTGPTAMVGAIRHRLEAGDGKWGKGGSGSGTGGSNRGGDGDTGIGSGSGFRTSLHEGVDHGRHRGGGVPGGQWFQRGRMERGGGLRQLQWTLKQTT